MAHPVEMVVCGLPFDRPERLDDALARVRDLGFTAVQIYTRWRDLEPRAEGGFDWSFYDPQVEAVRRHGLKWVPFFLMGPKYANPDWWRADPRHRGLVCLEHGRESGVESVWNPAFDAQVERVLAALADHYGPWKVIESLQPGINGDYGEAIFPVLGNWPGDYHTHQGFWCGGDDARADFAGWLRDNHADAAALAEAWRLEPGTARRFWDAPAPFPRHRAPSRRAWLAMVAWYRGAMTRYADRWMAACRAAFPDTPAYLCTGGDETPAHGSSFAEQARVAAAHGGGLRLTNEGNPFARNFLWTASTWAACRHYGARLGLEPVGPMTPRGVRERAFGSIAYGARQWFHYYANVVDPDRGRTDPPNPEIAAALAAYRAHGGASVDAHAPGRPVADGVEDGLAFYWPGARVALEGALPPAMEAALGAVRRRVAVSPLGDELIAAGALSRFKALLVVAAECAPVETLDAIAAWARLGGRTLLCAGRVLDVDGDPHAAFDALFGIGPEAMEEWGHARQYRFAAAEAWPEFGDLPHWHNDRGWTGLSPAARVLYGVDTERERAAAMMGQGARPAGVASMFTADLPDGGAALYHAGPLTLEDDPEATFRTALVFPRVLDAVCRRAGVSPRPAGPGDVARARVDGRDWVLREDGLASF